MTDMIISPPYTTAIKSNTMKWVGHIARVGELIKAYKVLVGKPEGKRPLGTFMHKWEDEDKN
jgi:hypothetical protein